MLMSHYFFVNSIYRKNKFALNYIYLLTLFMMENCIFKEAQKIVDELRNQHLKKDELTAVLWMALLDRLNDENPAISLKINDGLSKALDISAQTLHKYKNRNSVNSYKNIFPPETIKIILDLLEASVKQAKEKLQRIE